MAKPNPLLCALQQTAKTGNAFGLGTYLQSSSGVAPWIRTENLQFSLFLEHFGNR
jgi:hypothetical protein